MMVMQIFAKATIMKCSQTNKNLIDVLSKLRAEMKVDEPTGFFSGGPGMGKKLPEEEQEKDQNETI